MTATPHEPEQPSWECGSCGRPWPCAPAKRQLLADFAGRPGDLVVDLAGRCRIATADLCGARGVDPRLFHRFAGWIDAAVRDSRG